MKGKNTMSLETKIENLTIAINALNINISKLVNVPICDDPALAAEILDREMPKAAKAKAKAKAKEEETAPALTHKDVQDKIMLMVREDMSRKPKIKTLLAKYSSSKVSDLDAGKLTEFLTELNLL